MSALTDKIEQAEGGVGPGLWALLVCVPTLMVLAETPSHPSAHPRDVLAGHTAGVFCGYLALMATGLVRHPSALQEGLHAPRVVAACLSVGLTALLLQWMGTPHPPAGATTLIVSLGLFTTERALVVLLLSVAVCTLIAAALHGGLGVRQKGVARTDG